MHYKTLNQFGDSSNLRAKRIDDDYNVEKIFSKTTDHAWKRWPKELVDRRWPRTVFGILFDVIDPVNGRITDVNGKLNGIGMREIQCKQIGCNRSFDA